MKFGIFCELSVQRPWSDLSEWRVYHQAIEQICLADELGFDQIWEVEHHFLQEYSHSSAPEVFLAAVATQTKSIHIGTGITVCLPAVNHPARIAERAATLDIISNGRLEFGTGRAGTWAELGGFGVEPDHTKEMWDEVVHAIPKMWTQDSFAWEGKYFRMPARGVVPKPVQKPHPPMWVAVTSPETAIQAAERGIGLLGVSIGTAEQYRHRVSEYRRVIRDCNPVGAFVNDCVNGTTTMYCGESDEEANQVGVPMMQAFMNYSAHLTQIGQLYPSPAYTTQATSRELRRGRADVVSSSAMGSPDTVIRQLRQWEEIGVDRMVFIVAWDQIIPHSKVMASLKRFACEVMPAFPEPAKPSLTTVPDFASVEGGRQMLSAAS